MHKIYTEQQQIKDIRIEETRLAKLISDDGEESPSPFTIKNILNFSKNIEVFSSEFLKDDVALLKS